MDTTATRQNGERGESINSVFVSGTPLVLLYLIIAFGDVAAPACWTAIDACSIWQHLILLAFIGSAAKVAFAFAGYLLHDLIWFRVVKFGSIQIAPSTILAVFAAIVAYACIRATGGIDEAWLKFMTPVGMLLGYVFLVLASLAVVVAAVFSILAWKLSGVAAGALARWTGRR